MLSLLLAALTLGCASFVSFYPSSSADDRLVAGLECREIQQRLEDESRYLTFHNNKAYSDTALATFGGLVAVYSLASFLNGAPGQGLVAAAVSILFFAFLEGEDQQRFFREDKQTREKARERLGYINALRKEERKRCR